MIKLRQLRFPKLLLLTIVLSCIAGCAPGPNIVSGTVTVDGQPLKEGLIRFVPIDGEGQPASATIAEGKFSGPVNPGEMRVEISANKVTGKHKMYDTPDSPTVDDVAELLPERFNAKSELKISVKGGNQSEKFEVQSK